jgi:nucleoside-diphosphate-sugar epimerase
MDEKGRSEFVGRKVLVAGASGFLGGKLSARLAQIGADVIAISRNSPAAIHEGVRWQQVDASNITAVRQLYCEERPDIVCQLCGQPDGARNVDLVLPIFESDVRTTINFLIAAVEYPVHRFITTASLEEPILMEPPTSPYSAAKVASTAYARMFHLVFGVPVVILRPFMTYGPGQPNTKVVAYILNCLLRGEPPKLSSGSRLVDWIYIDDVISGFLAGMTAHGIEGGTFDLGSGVLVTIQDVAETLSSLTNAKVRPAFSVLPERLAETIRAADIKEARLKLGWQPRVPLDEGLRLTVEECKQRFSSDMRFS